jgi:hypothetical protein
MREEHRLDLSACFKEPIRLACDSEFEGPHTLTVQFAVRVEDQIIVQVYRSPAIPEPSKLNINGFTTMFKPWCTKVVVRPIKLITRKLSPVRVLTDLFQWKEVKPLSRLKGGDPAIVDLAEPINVTLIAHYWPADFFRIFGSEFFNNLALACTEAKIRLFIQANKLLMFREKGRYTPPVLEYIRTEDSVIPVCIQTFDTNLPFDRTSLDNHAKTFLGLAKLEAITKADKGRMLKTFQTKSADAYRYAIQDVVLTLLIEEQMRVVDRTMYKDLGFAEEDVPTLRPTQGGRVVEMITKSIVKNCAAGSVLLSKTGRLLKDGSIGAVSLAKVKNLLKRGSAEFIASEKSSRFGDQTGDTHGGMQFSRSPMKFFHEAPGQFRDVDLSGCYAAIISGMSLYVGRPVIHEPGSRGMKLKDAIEFVEKHAVGRDGWIVKVSGPITRSPNVLVPSTKGALTNENYQRRAAKRRATSQRPAFMFDWVQEPRKRTGNAMIFTDVIEAGIIAWSTWLMIKALPTELRREYEELDVDSIVFYPKNLVADSGAEFDTLTEQFATDDTSWTAKMDMKKMQRIIVEKLDSDYVSLCYPIGELAKQIAGFRQNAREQHGKGSGADVTWKLTANAIYGVSACKYHVTNNIVCANLITATGRALAFAMQMAMNGVQVITDGCTYRRDQIPADTFVDCLRASNEYPIQRVEDGVRFLNPAKVPQGDADFTEWYRRHVRRFFNVSSPEYDELFDIHSLEHKGCGDPKQAAFDGLCCDGSANYLKLLRENDSWKVVDSKTRGFKKEAMEKITPWILDTYQSDKYVGPPPIAESVSLLSFKDAVRVTQQARKVLRNNRASKGCSASHAQIMFPLGFDQRRVQAYKIIKKSAFLYRTPDQYAKFVKAMQKFSDSCGCGLEVLALRRSHGDRDKGSIQDIATIIYDYIRSGGDNLTKELNLTRAFEELERIREQHFDAMQERKRELRDKLYHAIDARQLEDEATLTGLLVQDSTAILIE